MIRTDLCNVIANEIEERLAFDPEPETAPTAAELVAKTWEQVDVPTSSNTWARWEAVTLDTEEQAYVLARIGEN